MCYAAKQHFNFLEIKKTAANFSIFNFPVSVKISRASWVLVMYFPLSCSSWCCWKVGVVDGCGKREAATPRWNLTVGAVTFDSTSKYSYCSNGSAMITCREKDLSVSGYCLCMDTPGKSFGELEPVIWSVYY